MKRTPFFKILVANRGEIALRIMRTARRLGYGVVAVYSDADRDALHVREADQAVRIGEALPAQSYLRIDAIIAAAKASGASAVHPGYGFLAENEDFAQACRDAGLVFIGPSPEAIRAMGNKAGAKDIMQKAGVPCVPGYQGADQSDAVMLAEAKKIGFPVMIKAVAGGGGRGMRLVADAAAFPDALRSARSEAQGAFGDPTVILERAIVDPRHIEIQVFGDRYGNAIHLGERDCSVQRRHQKLIEEAPSPKVTPELRARMGAVAVAAVKSIGYEGAGTLEFLLDPERRVLFHGNEHAAAGRASRHRGDHRARSGRTAVAHRQRRAARAQAGGCQILRPRHRGAAVLGGCRPRFHAAVRQDGAVADAGWRPRRARAAIRLRDSAVLRFDDRQDHQPWRRSQRGAGPADLRAGADRGVRRHHQSGISDFLPASSRLCQRAKRPRLSSAIIATNCWRRARTTTRKPRWPRLLLYVTNPHAPPWRSGRSLAATFPLTMRIDLGHGVQEVDIVRERDGGYVAAVDGGELRFEIDELGRDAIRFRTDGMMESAKFLRDGDRLYILHRGATIAVRDLTLAAPVSAAAAGGDGKVRAAMNGRVVAVLVKPGEQVARRPARDDAGSDEDGACAHGGCRGHGVVDRCGRRRAGDDGEDRRGDRGGVLISPAP